MGGALAHATRASLLLIDEWGKGTAAADGAALFAATVRYLAGAGAGAGAGAESRTGLCAPPRALLTTHFQTIFDADVLGKALPVRADARRGRNLRRDF